MKIITGLALFATTALFLTACSDLGGEHAIVSNHEKNYTQSKSLPPLHLPEGVEGNSINSQYPVPANRPKFTGPPSLIPPGNPGAA